jgi:chromosome segregation ATPase
VGRWRGRLAEERQLWNEEYARLQEEREVLQNFIEEQQADNQSLSHQLTDTLQQNAQLISELTDAQLSYRYLKETIAQQPPTQQQAPSQHTSHPASP